MPQITESDYITEAQRIAFAPFEFQATKALIETAIYTIINGVTLNKSERT